MSSEKTGKSNPKLLYKVDYQKGAVLTCCAGATAVVLVYRYQ